MPNKNKTACKRRKCERSRSRSQGQRRRYRTARNGGRSPWLFSSEASDTRRRNIQPQGIKKKPTRRKSRHGASLEDSMKRMKLATTAEEEYANMVKLRSDVKQKFRLLSHRFIRMTRSTDPFFNNKFIEPETLQVFSPSIGKGPPILRGSIAFNDYTLKELLHLTPEDYEGYTAIPEDLSGGRYAPKRKMHRLR